MDFGIETSEPGPVSVRIEDRNGMVVAEGGVHLVLGAADGRAGIPASNPNLTPEIEAEVAEVAKLIADGSIVVQDTADGLIK